MGCSTSACSYCGKDLYSYSWDKAVKHVEKCKPQLTKGDKG